MITNKIPGGNIQVVSVEGHRIELDVEMRDSSGDWFYWCFKAVFPEKGIYRFHFARDNKVGTRGPAFSLDDGRTWRRKVLPAPPCHTLAYPHKGLRWRYCGCEPVVAEYADGHLEMLLRTSTDFHYHCYSYDGGESWSEMTPSPFYSVATMPNLLSLSDGRMLAVWNNTTPLPELDHELQPELPAYERDGSWEDVFTNRDALHAAISEDQGKSWIGFRELVLNERRNDADFRTSGGNYDSLEKSVQQNHVFELT